MIYVLIRQKINMDTNTKLIFKKIFLLLQKSNCNWRVGPINVWFIYKKVDLKNMNAHVKLKQYSDLYNTFFNIDKITKFDKIGIMFYTGIYTDDLYPGYMLLLLYTI